MKIYLSDKKSLAFFQQKATACFWDDHWKTEDLRSQIISCQTDRYFIPAVKKILPLNSLVLEGGCGKGLLVHALNFQQYRAIGLDFAQETIVNVKKAVPEMSMVAGNVFSLPLRNKSIDGYVSVGVIEHFAGGYSQILLEMNRVIREGGFLFISFPYMSPLRRLKAYLRLYPVENSAKLHGNEGRFYQFALPHASVVRELEELGFVLKDTTVYDGIKGFKDEVTWAKPFLQRLYDENMLTGRFSRNVKNIINYILKPFASHCILLVLQKAS